MTALKTQCILVRMMLTYAFLIQDDVIISVTYSLSVIQLVFIAYCISLFVCVACTMLCTLVLVDGWLNTSNV